MFAKIVIELELEDPPTGTYQHQSKPLFTMHASMRRRALRPVSMACDRVAASDSCFCFCRMGSGWGESVRPISGESLSSRTDLRGGLGKGRKKR
jgi:hypothetical protein